MSKTGTSLSLRNNGFILMVSSIMSGNDSPTSANKEFDYSASGRSSPQPTASHVIHKRELPQIDEIIKEDVKPVLKEKKDDEVKDDANKDEKDGKDEKEKDKKDELDINSPDANPGYKPESNKQIDGRKKDDFKEGGGGKDGVTGDTMQKQWVSQLDAKTEDENEDNCIVNCFYYTMQCCECSIS